ncbi:ABC transporter ATP-binding protein [Desulfococcus sp.]|uniref:ABC transporter ATP-binding protein n=1 Tax=Desulfococcus sp. TaxID=2025834 RepID=UPI003D0E8959
MITLKNVSKIFNAGRPNEFHALKNVTLTIAREKITVFKGPSGSGKTTLLSLIGCMSRPTSGRIFVDGQETTSLPERFLSDIRRSDFGFIFQNYNLIKGITVLENTMLPAYPTGRRHAAVKADAMRLLARLNIDDKAGQKVERLSGGEQQRTAIARALINNPAVIIADEPTAHLDMALSMEFLDIVAEFFGDRKTILMASHDPLVFEAGIVHAVVEMRDGSILEEKQIP